MQNHIFSLRSNFNYCITVFLALNGTGRNHEPKSHERNSLNISLTDMNSELAVSRHELFFFYLLCRSTYNGDVGLTLLPYSLPFSCKA